MDNKCYDLLLQERCDKLFLLMNISTMKGFNFDLKWAFKVRNRLEKLDRKLQETKRKYLRNFSENA